MGIELLPLKTWMAESSALLGRAARSLDRAIRRIEDRHRGPLPYMRATIKDAESDQDRARDPDHVSRPV